MCWIEKCNQDDRYRCGGYRQNAVFQTEQSRSCWTENQGI